MPDKDLTIAQRSVLLTLMIDAAPVPNQIFRSIGISLDKAKRNDLVQKGLITVTERPLVLTLTDKGWKTVRDEMRAEAPPRAGSMGGTLYRLMNFLNGYFERNDLSAPEVFGSGAAPRAVDVGATPGVADSALETRIRKAYAELAPCVGDYVMLEDLRSVLSDVTDARISSALQELDRAADVHLVPESNQKVLTVGQRAAAIRIGRQDMHLIAIGS
jgi:hypothetical protein